MAGSSSAVEEGLHPSLEGSERNSVEVGTVLQGSIDSLASGSEEEC